MKRCVTFNKFVFDYSGFELCWKHVNKIYRKKGLIVFSDQHGIWTSYNFRQESKKGISYQLSNHIPVKFSQIELCLSGNILLIWNDEDWEFVGIQKMACGVGLLVIRVKLPHSSVLPLTYFFQLKCVLLSWCVWHLLREYLPITPTQKILIFTIEGKALLCTTHITHLLDLHL